MNNNVVCIHIIWLFFRMTVITPRQTALAPDLAARSDLSIPFLLSVEIWASKPPLKVYIIIPNYGPGPHWGTVRKKMSPASIKVYAVSHVYYR